MAKEHDYHFSSKGDKKSYEIMRKITQMPLAAQRVFYFGHSSYPSRFSAYSTFESPDKVSVVHNVFNLKWGTYGFYIAASRQGKTGITYHFKGATANRLRIWGNSALYDVTALVKQLVLKYYPSSMHLFSDTFIKSLGTKGMFSRIIAGKITTVQEAVEYYIMYSMRGTGIKKESAHVLEHFVKFGLEKSLDFHQMKKLLRIAKEPNQFLEQFQSWENEHKRSLIHEGHDLIRTCSILGEKIDWTQSLQELSNNRSKLAKKASVVKDILMCWEGGHTYVVDGLRKDGSVNCYYSKHAHDFYLYTNHSFSETL